MKKMIIIMSTLVALAACNKETPILESLIDPSQVVFNINVENANATKGIKTAWENGDVVYAFFEGNSTQYVKMTYDGSSWSYKDKDGGTTFSGLTLSASGKKVSAVIFLASCALPPLLTKMTSGSLRVQRAISSTPMASLTPSSPLPM